MTDFKTLTTLLLLIAFSLFPEISKGQLYKPDSIGYVADPAFHRMVKQRGFQLVTHYKVVQTNPLVLKADVMLKDKWYKMDLNGKLEPIPPKMEKKKEEDLYKEIDPMNYDVRGVEEVHHYSSGNVESNYTSVIVNGKYGTIHKTSGDTGLAPIYDGIVFLEGTTIVEFQQNGQSGLAHQDGRIITKRLYDQIDLTLFFNDSTPFPMRARRMEKFTLIDSSGGELIDAIYTELWPFETYYKERFAKVRTASGYGLLSLSGKTIIPCHYRDLQPLNFYLIRTESSHGKGLADLNGKTVLDTVYEEIIRDYDGHIRITRKKKTGLLNPYGKVWLHPDYESVGQMFDGKVVVMKDKRYGLVDTTENVLAEPIYSNFRLLPDNNFYEVLKDGKYGMLDLSGKTIIAPKYNLLAYSNGHFIFREDSISGMLDRNGNVINTFDFKVTYRDQLYFHISKNGKTGLIDGNGNLILHPVFDSVHPHSESPHTGLFGAVHNGHDCQADRYGNILYYPKTKDR